MIITKKVNVSINGNNKKTYEKIHNDLNIKDIIEISPIQLMKGSHVEILCSCDICGKEKLIEYRIYYKITNGIKEKYYCHKCSKDKWEKTNLERYGSIYPQRNEVIKRKIVETNLDRYGVEHSSQLNEYKDKQKNTNMEKYGISSPLKDIKKRKNGMIEKYGVDSPMKNEILKNKIGNTCVERYGCENPMQNEDVRKKVISTCIEKYGCENPMQNEEVKNKFVNTCIERYGFNHHFQNQDMYIKLMKSTLKMKKYKNTDLYYQGTYEKDFLDLCDKLNIIDKVKRGCSVKYDMNEKHLIYFPDFYIEEQNLLIEIKSLYWYNKHKDRNILKESKCKELGFEYILIMDKNYDEFLNNL